MTVGPTLRRVLLVSPTGVTRQLARTRPGPEWAPRLPPQGGSLVRGARSKRVENGAWTR